MLLHATLWLVDGLVDRWWRAPFVVCSPIVGSYKDDMVIFGIRCWQFASRLPRSPIEAGQRIVDASPELAYDSPDSLTVHLPHRPSPLEAGGEDRYGKWRRGQLPRRGRQAVTLAMMHDETIEVVTGPVSRPSPVFSKLRHCSAAR